MLTAQELSIKVGCSEPGTKTTVKEPSKVKMEDIRPVKNRIDFGKECFMCAVGYAVKGYNNCYSCASTQLNSDRD